MWLVSHEHSPDILIILKDLVMWGEKPWRPKTIPDWAQVSSDSIEHLCRLPLHRNGDHWSWFQLSAAQLAEH